MTRIKGIVFITVLVFLLIFSSLSLLSIMTNTLLYKSQVRLWNREQSLMLVIHILKDLEHNLQNEPSDCRIPVTPFMDLANRPLSWWERAGCRGNFSQIRYYYVIETLGVDFCGSVRTNDNNQYVMPEFYRITLMALSNKNNYKWQSTVVRPHNQKPACATKLHEVMIGLQMRRQI